MYNKKFLGPAVMICALLTDGETDGRRTKSDRYSSDDFQSAELKRGVIAIARMTDSQLS